MASLFSSRLTSAYTALQGARGAPQTPTETIDKLVDRIQTAELVEDRRTAVLGLKGCTREYKEVREMWREGGREGTLTDGWLNDPMRLDNCSKSATGRCRRSSRCSSTMHRTTPKSQRPCSRRSCS